MQSIQNTAAFPVYVSVTVVTAWIGLSAGFNIASMRDEPSHVTVPSRYITVSFLQISRKRLPIARPSGRGLCCLF